MLYYNIAFIIVVDSQPLRRPKATLMKQGRCHCACTVLGLAAFLASGSVASGVPKVAVDILPIHSLVSQVMGDIGKPDLIVRPGASPHGYAMRPSEARALQDADIFFWVGGELTTWLENAIEKLAGHAVSVALSETRGTTLLTYREGVTFETHGRDEKHGAVHKHGDGHDHEGFNPHLWLDPENARVWLDAIASELAKLDPDSASTYFQNARTGKDKLAQLISELSDQLAPLRGRLFVVFHDAYHYFEHRFQIEAAGAISLSDAADPGPARVAQIRNTVRDLDVTCVFTEPQFEPKLVATVIEGADARAGVLDPLGASLQPGSDLYPQLLSDLTAGLRACLE